MHYEHYKQLGISSLSTELLRTLREVGMVDNSSSSSIQVRTDLANQNANCVFLS